MREKQKEVTGSMHARQYLVREVSEDGPRRVVVIRMRRHDK